MPVIINNSNPKIKKESLICNNCKKSKLCIRLEETNICRPCWNKINKEKYLWTVYCGICGHLTTEEEYKTCSECNKIAGWSCGCGALYYCQSGDCKCKKCFDYKCDGDNCDNDLPYDQQYVADVESTSNVAPYCETCKSSF